ncbi:MAG: hypothetical protein KJO15_11105 [Alphaproteobacteria bacterium]|nr:hypothetical protein [Alphaproteobacteria bacterium]
MGDHSSTSDRSRTSNGPDGLLERVLRAERDAEDRLTEARKHRDEIIDRARASAQAVERKTDDRLETRRRLYSAETQARAQAIADQDGGEVTSARKPVSSDRTGEAATRMARRLIGLSE